MQGTAAVCANCGQCGHVFCLGLQELQGFPFCSDCLPVVTLQFAEMERQQAQQEWRLRHADQLGQWKVMATRIMGASASVGVTLGGVAATAAGAAVAGVQGLVQGVSQAAGGQRALLDIPDLEVEAPPALLPMSSSTSCSGIRCQVVEFLLFF